MFWCQSQHDDSSSRTDPGLQHTSQVGDTEFDCFKGKGLYFIHLNCRSLIPKVDEFCLIATNSRAAVISITESCLDDSVQDSEIHIPGYNVVRRDRGEEEEYVRA